jgi:hypothetical protein
MSAANDKPQSFDNHRAWPPPAFLIAGLVLLVEICHRVLVAVVAPDFGSFWAVLVGVALLIVWFASRSRAQIVQDRVIRLEMSLRLERLLDPSRYADIRRLKPAQLIALRFAGDAELPDLVGEVLAGKLAKPDDIKRRVRDWQPDWLRV